MADRRRALGALLAVVVGAACSGGGDRGTQKAAPAPPAASGWQTQGVKAVGPVTGDGDTVAVVDGSVPDLSAVVLDATTGTVRFRRPWSPSGQYTGMGVGSPAVVGDIVATMEASGDGTAIVGVDAHTGAERWRRLVAESFAPFACGALVCTEQGPAERAVLVARDPATGATEWTSTGWQSSFRPRPDLYISLHLGAPILYSLDPATGATRWRTDLRPALGSSATTGLGWDLTLVGGVLITALDAGTVGVDPSTGSVKWTRISLHLCPVVAATIVILCDGNLGLHRIDPATGTERWATASMSIPTELGPIMGVAADESALFAKDVAKRSVRIDARTGAVTPVTGDTVAWMMVAAQVDARRSPGAAVEGFLGLIDLVPLNAAGGSAPAVTHGSQIPVTVGVTVSGRRVFVDGSGAVRAVGI